MGRCHRDASVRAEERQWHTVSAAERSGMFAGDGGHRHAGQLRSAAEGLLSAGAHRLHRGKGGKRPMERSHRDRSGIAAEPSGPFHGTGFGSWLSPTLGGEPSQVLVCGAGCMPGMDLSYLSARCMVVMGGGCCDMA